MASTLTYSDGCLLRLAYAELQDGRADQALATMRDLHERVNHPDVLAIRGLACRKLGRLPDAAAAFASALELAPKNPQLLNLYGNVLEDLGLADEAKEVLWEVTKLAPEWAEGWMNLGISLSNTGRPEDALGPLRRAVSLAPADALCRSALGHAEQRVGQFDQAVVNFRDALRIDPNVVSARFNLAASLRALDLPDEALEEADQASGLVAKFEEAQCLRAEILADLGRCNDAIEQFDAVLDSNPENVAAQSSRARLLPQMGKTEVSLERYMQGLAERPNSLPLWMSALDAARALKNPEQLLRWAAEAKGRVGPSPLLTTYEAIGHGMHGDAATAATIIRPLAEAGDHAALIHASEFALRVGELEEAERYALAATRSNARALAPWAYLSIIWRLMADPRERWLADYEQLVVPLDLTQHMGAGPSQFLSEVEDALTKLHVMKASPGEQSLRYGTQTRRTILGSSLPVLKRLGVLIKNATETALKQLPADADHPFLARNSGAIRYKSSWSVRLLDSGYHVSHVHPEGWLSSAFYVALPPEIGKNARNDAPQESSPGVLLFGVPDPNFGLHLDPRRVEVPEPGKLVIFPSYFWHGTVPFESATARLTVAFDAQPA